ncbi:hypothetical protein Zmor_023240 [Zophobas morio]|uniref:Fibrinogen C-terminal domain-containing protein n=1 Tax=Zophobas morio TaxID=2755281 RepID=A0AA38HWL9_9CUCU|nr:hypothetical protein Zmor_023240 [Zophobas morio]
MIRKSFFTLCLSLNLIFFSSENDQEKFDIVSTSQRPSNSLSVEQALTSQIENLNTKLKALETELKHRIEALESTNNLKSEQLTHCLTTLESKNVQAYWLKQHQHPPTNCREVKDRGYDVSTTYLIKPDFAPNATKVLCDLEKKGGGWTYILNRFDGSQSFDFDLEDYKKGFGKLSGEFWLGLDNVYYLTGYKMNELLVELVDWNDQSVYAYYDRFRVGSEDEGYVMTVSGYNGTAGDSLSYSNNMKFSTKTKDFDKSSTASCAEYFDASWWYNYCMKSLLTGKYLKGEVSQEHKDKIMFWQTFRGTAYSLKEVRMMVRPRVKSDGN